MKSHTSPKIDDLGEFIKKIVHNKKCTQLKMEKKGSKKMFVTNLQSPKTGAPAANQFCIMKSDKNCIVFRSYTTDICAKMGRDFLINKFAFDYSRTTTKYLRVFLSGFGFSAEDFDLIRKKTRAGVDFRAGDCSFWVSEDMEKSTL